MPQSDNQSSSNKSTGGKTYDQASILSAIQKQYNLSESQMKQASFDVQDGKFNGITIQNSSD